jgi:hypothetical protein
VKDLPQQVESVRAVFAAGVGERTIIVRPPPAFLGQPDEPCEILFLFAGLVTLRPEDAANEGQPDDQRRTERAITIRCTSLVPSPISQSFASR